LYFQFCFIHYSGKNLYFQCCSVHNKGVNSCILSVLFCTLQRAKSCISILFYCQGPPSVLSVFSIHYREPRAVLSVLFYAPQGGKSCTFSLVLYTTESQELYFPFSSIHYREPRAVHFQFCSICILRRAKSCIFSSVLYTTEGRELYFQFCSIHYREPRAVRSVLFYTLRRTKSCIFNFVLYTTESL
jgi:hypothetical protein